MHTTTEGLSLNSGNSGGNDEDSTPRGRFSSSYRQRIPNMDLRWVSGS